MGNRQSGSGAPNWCSGCGGAQRHHRRLLGTQTRLAGGALVWGAASVCLHAWQNIGMRMEDVRLLNCVRYQRAPGCACASVPGAQAVHWLIDELKATVPIWKKEFFEDGSVWKENEESRRLLLQQQHQT